MPDDTPTQSSQPDQPGKKPALGLSLTQLVGGSAAAATAAVLGARLGTTGTIIGAALVSLVSAVASAVYTASLRRTQEVVARTKELLPTTVTWRTTRDPLPEVAEQAAEEGVEEATPSVWSRVRWRSVAMAAGAFFLITALLVTGYELVSGRSIEGSGRSTAYNVVHGGAKPTNTPTPTSRPSPRPSSTKTSTPATSATPSEPAGSTPSATPSSTPTTTPTASPTGSASPSASPTQ